MKYNTASFVWQIIHQQTNLELSQLHQSRGHIVMYFEQSRQGERNVLGATDRGHCPGW